MWKPISIFIPVFILATFFTFLLGAVSGRSPAALQLGDSATPDAVAALNHQFGLDQPFFVRYFDWLGTLLSGNFGNSWVSGVPVAKLLGDRAVVSLSVAGLALLIGLVFGFILGAVAAHFQTRWPDRVITTGTTVISVLPPFVVGIALIAVFAIWLRWLPAVGFVPITKGFWPWASHLILPAVALSFDTVSDVARQLRTGLVSVYRENYVIGATVRGIGPRRVFWVHVLRNGVGPALSVLGLKFPALLGGAVLIESIFGLAGYGVFAAQSAVSGDVPSVQAVLVISVVLVVVFNLLVNVVLNRLIPSAARGV
ncbi:ABC transporter permease [Subtercola lobariae]|uniref:ABC transporter permease n=1 Tax=Subtercola lobariae TaxID=1588641 RepID=A0A917EVH0_9MICO|nr:ABC transporter permease [Subtercola lobariae]